MHFNGIALIYGCLVISACVVFGFASLYLRTGLGIIFSKYVESMVGGAGSMPQGNTTTSP